MPAHSLPFEPARRFRSAGDLGDEVLAHCQGKRIAVLIVAYDAATTLLRVFKRIPPVVWRDVGEVALLDDANRDATYEFAAGVKTRHNLAKLTVRKHPSNSGYGGDQKAGCRYLIGRGFDAVVLLHGDGQYALELPARVYAPLVRGEAEAVPGSPDNEEVWETAEGQLATVPIRGEPGSHISRKPHAGHEADGISLRLPGLFG